MYWIEAIDRFTRGSRRAMEQIIDFIGTENVGNAMVIIVLTGMAFVYLFCCELHFQENKLMASNQKIVITKQGIGFCGLLFIVLLLLKVGIVKTVVVGWSWWWIFAPLWGPLALFVGILLLIGIMYLSCYLCYWLIKLIMYIIRRIKKNRKNKLRRHQKSHLTPPT